MSRRRASSVRRALVGSFSLLAALSLGSCGKTADSRGGLMLIISSDGDLPIGRLDINVQSKGKTQLANQYRVPEEATLPTTVALVSNGDPTAQAQISVTAWQVDGNTNTPLDHRDAIVTQVPTDHVATLRVVFNAACASKVKLVGDVAESTCGDGQTCNGAGDCASVNVVATELPVYHSGDENNAGGAPGSDAGAGGEPSSAGGSGGETAGSGGMGGAPVVAACGNGKLDANEKCDDGNALPGDGCSATCAVETGWVCDQAAPSVCTATCGDGIVVGPEAMAGGCDDSNSTPNDGCSPTCKTEPGYACSGAPSSCAKTCGNGKIDAGETCEDGNTMTGDGCASCATETGYSCDNSTLPSKCADVNECVFGTFPCDAQANCTNTIGSYTCACNTGFTGDGKTCTDINECTSGGGPACTSNALCTNTPGSYTCACKTGYTGDGKTTCTDINECLNNPCTANTHTACVNKPGTYQCTCTTGYVGNGTVCSVFTEFTGSGNGGSAISSIALGSDSNLWYAENAGNNITRITQAGVVTKYAMLASDRGFSGIVAGSDGNLWVSEASVDSIGRITVGTGALTEYAVPSTGAYPQGITLGADNGLWFTENRTHKIGKYVAGAFFEYPTLTVNAGPMGITQGADGNVWFTEQAANKIGRITTAGVITEFAIPTAAASAMGIAPGPDGNLWFTEMNANKIGRITTAGVITEFALATASAGPMMIAPGPDGNMWFGEWSNEAVARISTTGTNVVEYALTYPTSFPGGLVAAGGNVYFAEGPGKVGRITP